MTFVMSLSTLGCRFNCLHAFVSILLNLVDAPMTGVLVTDIDSMEAPWQWHAVPLGALATGASFGRG